LIPCREFLLRQAERTPQRFRARNAPHCGQSFVSQRLPVGVGQRYRVNFLLGQFPKVLPVRLVGKRLRRTVRSRLNERSVTLPFGYNSILLAHAVLLFSRR
jgi:hypothetical protein